MNRLEIYKWCPHCEKEEILNKAPKSVKSGSDGWGQPVRYSECDCGELFGWFNIDHYKYRDKSFEFTDSFKNYLQSRIRFYLGLEDNL